MTRSADAYPMLAMILERPVDKNAGSREARILDSRTTADEDSFATTALHRMNVARLAMPAAARF